MDNLLPESDLPHHHSYFRFSWKWKTTLGDWIVEYGGSVVVKDTDQFIQRGDEEDKRLEEFREDSEKYRSELWSLKTRKIESFVRENDDKDVVVFVGLMDHFGLKPFYDFKQATFKYFIDIEPEILLKQYYTRLPKIGENDPSLWKDVANGRDYIMSSMEKILDNEALSKEHIEHGYELITIDNLKLLFTSKQL